jgi:hypothetical protein
MQTVINLSHNDVPNNSFNSLIKKELEALIEPLTQWNDGDAMLSVEKAQRRGDTKSALAGATQSRTRAEGLQ